MERGLRLHRRETYVNRPAETASRAREFAKVSGTEWDRGGRSLGKVVMIVNEPIWSHWAQSHSFQERGVLDVIGHGLKKVYGEPEEDPLPETLRHLVSELEQAERRSMRSSDR